MQNLVDVGRREGGLRREGIFRYFVFYFLYSCPCLQVRRRITTVYGSKRVFPRKVGPFGISMIKTNVWESKLPQDMIFGDLNRHFKPNLRNFRNAISRKVRTRPTRNLKENFRCTNKLLGWSSITKL